MTAKLDLKPLLATLDALSVEVISRIGIARTAASNNEAIGALNRVDELVGDMSALIRTVHSLHRNRLFTRPKGRS